MLCVLVAAVLAVAAAEVHGDHTHECPSLAGGKLEKLKSHLVTVDVHDLILGDQKEVWGPKQFMEMDSDACLTSSSTKKDDHNIEHTETFKNKGWNDGDKEFSSTSVQEKLENGVYLIKRGGTEPYGMAYYVYAKDGVVAHYMCKLNAEKEEGKKKWHEPFISYVKVAAADAKVPLDANVQKNVDEALKILQSDPELFGEMQQHTHFC